MQRQKQHKTKLYMMIIIIMVLANAVFSAEFYDDFQNNDPDSNGVGPDWVAQNSNAGWTETSGYITDNGSHSTEGHLINNFACEKNGIFAASIQNGYQSGDLSACHVGILFRWTSTSSFYYMSFAETATELEVRLDTVITSSGGAVGSLTKTSWNTNTEPFWVRVKCIADTFTVFISTDGSTYDSIGYIVDNTRDSGSVGIGAVGDNQSGAKIDSIFWKDTLSYGDKHKANNVTNLNLTGSWVEGVVPTEYDTAVWDATVTAANTTSLGANTSWNKIKIEDPGGSITINSNTLTLGVGGIDMSSSTNNATINSSVILGASQDWDVSGTLRVLNVVGAITGTYAIDKKGTGILRYTSNSNTYSGGTTITDGKLQIGANTSEGSLPGNVTNNSELIFYKTIPYTYSGVISGTGTVTQSGSDTLTLSANQTYTGATSVIEGTLKQTGAGNDATHTSGIAISSGAVYELAIGHATRLSSDAILITGAGTFRKSGPNYNHLAAGATAQSFSMSSGALIDITGGSLSQFTTSSTNLADLTIASGCNAYINDADANSTVYFNALSGDGLLNLYNITNPRTVVLGKDNGTGTFSGVISNTGTMNITKEGTGTQTFSGNNTYIGVTTVSAGVLNIQHANALGSSLGSTTVNSGATLEIQGGITVPEAVNVSGSGASSTGAILNVSGDNTISGDIALGSSSSFGVTSGTLTLGGNISGSYNFTKAGAGTVVLEGTNSFTGNTSISAGELKVNGNITNSSATSVSGSATLSGEGSVNSFATIAHSAIIEPGDGGAGKLTLGGGALLNSTSILNIDIGTNSDTIAVTGNLTLDGQLVVDSLSGFTPGTFTIMTYSGTLTDNTLEVTTNFNASYTYTVTTDADEVFLTVSGGGEVVKDNNTTDLSIGSSWVGGTVPGVNDTAVWDNTVTADSTIANLGGDLSWEGIKILDPGAQVTIDGDGSTNTLTLGVGGVDMSASTRWAVINNKVALGANQVWNVAANKGLTINGPISGAYTLTVDGTGVVRLGKDGNTWSGGTTISGGTLQVGNEGEAGDLPGDVTNNSALVFNQTDSYTYGGIISGTGTVSQSGSNVATLSATNTYTGQTNVTAGRLRIQNKDALGGTGTGTVVNSGASLEIDGNFVGASSVYEPLTINGSGINDSGALNNITAQSEMYGDITLGSNSTIAATANAYFILRGVVSGAYDVTKIGVGSMVLVSDNTYTGNTHIQNGSIWIEQATSLGTTDGNTVIDSGTSVALNTTNKTIAENFVINGPGKLSSGAIYNYSGENFLTGTINIASNSDINNASGSFLYLDGIVSGAGDLTKIGTGPMVLRGDNTYTGLTTIDAGLIWVKHGNAFGATSSGTVVTSGTGIVVYDSLTLVEPLTLNGTGRGSGALEFYSGETFHTGTISLASAATIGGGATDYNYLDGVISGSGDLTKVSTNAIVIRGDNTYTGATTVSAGNLWIRHDNALGSSSSGTSVTSGASLILYGGVNSSEPLTLNGVGSGSYGALISNSSVNSVSGTVTLNSASTISCENDTFTIGGVVSGANALTKIGSGVLILSGNNTYSGATNANAGILVVKHANALGTVGPVTTVASGATVGIQGGVSSPEDFSLNGNGASNAGALLNLSGNNTFSGNIILSSDCNIGSAADELELSGIISGNGVGISKVGNGTVILSGVSTYTGNTNVSAGDLRVNGETDDRSPVSVGSGSVISGTGTIGDDLTISGNGIIEPGDNGAGKLTAAGNVIFNSTSVYNVDLGTVSDTISIAGALTLDGTVNITAGAGFDVGTYSIITYSGSLTDNIMDVGTVPNGYACSLAVTASTVDLIITTTNNDPTAIALSSSNVDEKLASGSPIGLLTTTDPDTGDSHTYSLPGGVLGNANFSISNDTLVTGTIFDYENGDKTFEVSIQTDDGNGGTFIDTFTITINSTESSSGTNSEINFSSAWKIGGGSGDLRQLASDRFFDGHLDEIRIENTMRSADWIKLCYETQKLNQNTVTFMMGDNIDLLPLTVNHNVGTGTSDTIMVYTDSFTLVFDEDLGGGIKWLSDAANKGGTNQVSAGGSVTLFDIRFATNAYNGTGVLEVLESNSLFAKIKQTFELASVKFSTVYTVYGDGKIFIDVSSYNNSGSDQTNTLYFSTFRDVSGTANRVTSTGAASTSDFILNADNGAGQFDILLSPFGLWSDASGFDNGENTESRLGYIDGSRTLKAGYAENWSFLLDFGHKSWDDTTDQVHYYADAYQSPDSLSMNRGFYRMTKAWESKLLLHYDFDEEISGSADGDTVNDYSEATPTLYNGVIEGGTWTTGKWGEGALTLATADSIAIINSANFNSLSAFTISAWIKKSGTSETDALIFGDDNATTSGFKFVSDANSLKLVYSGTTLTGNIALGTDWRFVTATADVHKGWLKLFVDGKIDTTLYNLNLGFTDGTGNVSIGNGFAGNVDDVRFYSKEISEETIYAIYNNSYRAGQGMYSVRCNNNSSVDLSIDGSSSLPRYNPIFEISNYWGTSKPEAVYFNGSWLTDNTDYISYLDDGANMLYVGLNKTILSSDARCYIDDYDSTGAWTTGPTKKMTWGTSGDDFYVQNFTGTTFGSSDEEYYLKFTMPAANTANGGEIGEFKSSAIDPSAAITSASNVVSSSGKNVTFGYYDPLIGGVGWVKSATNITTKPTYTVLESSDVRIRLQIDDRTALNNTSYSYDIKTIWTIYPTGQIFRYDSIANLSHDISTTVFKVGQKYEAGVSNYAVDNNYYGGVHGGSTIHDFAMALLSGYSGGVSDNFYMGSADTVSFEESATGSDDFTVHRFLGYTDKLTTEEPFQLAYYFDIAHQAMSDAYIDSVCLGARNIVFDAGDMTIGTRLTNTWGDLDQDGFNESEGAYTIEASNNTIDFKIEADAATDRPKFYPAIKISNYFASKKPEYVHLYSGSDTATLIEGYQYNCHLNKTTDELIIQLDTVLTADVNCYISDDDDLAVTLSEFKAESFDEAVNVVWRTESELENAGFNIHRRVTPDFFRRTINKVESGDTTNCLSCAPIIDEDIWDDDTLWVSVNRRLIPGAEGGNSFGPLDYNYDDTDVFNHISYDYLLESVDFANIKDTFGPITVTPLPEEDVEENGSKDKIEFIAVPNPILFRDGSMDFYIAAPGEGNYTISICDNVGTMLFTKSGNYFSEGLDPQKVTSWDFIFEGRAIAPGSYIAILNYRNEQGFKRTQKLLLGVKR